MAGTTFIQMIKGATPTVAGITKLSDTSGKAMSEQMAEAIGNRNYIINGNFDIWQRGTSQTANGYGSDDRWSSQSTGATTKIHSREDFTVGQTDVPNHPKHYSRTTVISGMDINDRTIKFQPIEDVMTLAGQTGTVSFWAKADAPKNIAIEFYQNFTTGDADVNSIGSQLVALTTSWAKYEITVNIPNITGKSSTIDDSLQFVFWFDAGSNYNSRSASLGNQSGTFDIAQVKLEKGSVVSPFKPKTFAEELIDCQRYYEKSFSYEQAPANGVNTTSFITNTGISIACGHASQGTSGSVEFAVAKRVAPTVTRYGNSLGYWSYSLNSWHTGLSVTANGTRGLTLTQGVTGTLVNFRGHWAADAEL